MVPAPTKVAMKTSPKADGSILNTGTDNDCPASRIFLQLLLGDKLTELQRTAREQHEATGRSVVQILENDIGFVICHCGYSNPADNGLSFAVAVDPRTRVNCLAAKAARAALKQFKAEMRVERGEELNL